MDGKAPEIPPEFITAISSNAWADPGSDALRDILGNNLNLPNLRLFDSLDEMCRVAAQVKKGGYLDDESFCMVDSRSERTSPEDPRLILQQSLMIGGSIVPGDDVFIALDFSNDTSEATVKVFDWNERPPHRWVVADRLSSFLQKLTGRHAKHG